MHAGTTRAAVALSTSADGARAALEAARTISRGLDGHDPHWCVAFATPDHRPSLPALLDTLMSALGTPYVAGGSAAGILVPGGEVRQGPALGVLAVRSASIRATPFLFAGSADGGVEAGTQIGRRLSRARTGEDLICLWSDPRRGRAGRVLRGLQEALGPVTAVGGVPSRRPGDPGSFQFSGAEILDSAVAGVRLGAPHRRHVAITHGYRALGAPLRVTGAHGDLLLELDGRPAHRALLDRLPGAGDAAAESLGDRLVVAVLPADEDDDAPASASAAAVDLGALPLLDVRTVDPAAGVLDVGEPVEEGRRVALALHDPEAARADLRRRLAPVDPAAFRFGLYFDGTAPGRGLPAEGGTDAASLSRALPDLPFLGCVCDAAIGPYGEGSRTFRHRSVLALLADV